MARKLFYGWWIVLACTVVGFYVGGVIVYGFSAFFQPLIEEFGWTYTQISFAASLRGMEMGILSPIVGFLVARFGSRKLILLGTITTGLGLLLLSFTRSLATFYGAFLLLSFGAGGCTNVVTMSVVANWFSKNVGKALGIVSSGLGAGGLIVPLIIWLIDIYGWRTTLAILGLGMWILGIPLSFVIRDKPEQYGFFCDGESLPDPKTPVGNQNRGSEISFKKAIRQKTFLYLMVVELIRMVIVFAVITHVIPYLSSVGTPRPTAGIVAAGIPLLSIVGRLGYGWLGDFHDKRYVMAATFCLIGIGMMAFCYMQRGWIFTILFLLFFAPGYGGNIVLGRAILREYFGRDSFGKLLGVLMGFASLGGIIGPTFAGWMFDTLRSYYFTWLIFCGLNGVAIMLILRIKPTTKVNQYIPVQNP